MKTLIMLACLALAACEAADEEEPSEVESRETPFEPLTDQVDRAKAVEETVEQHKRDLDEAIDEAAERDERQ